MVSDLVGAIPFRATQVFDIHAIFHADYGPLPQGTNHMGRHHNKLIHWLNGEHWVLGNLQNDEKTLSL